MDILYVLKDFRKLNWTVAENFDSISRDRENYSITKIGIYDQTGKRIGTLTTKAKNWSANATYTID